MNKSCAVIAALALAGPCATRAVASEPHTYTYSIEHASFGKIGTFSDTVAQDGDTKRIDSKLRVAVRILGIVVHREDADRTEWWRNGRLAAFHSITTVNGRPIEVRGEAQGDGFVITSPAGTVVAPSDIYPSSPWVAGPGMSEHASLMMSTKTGKVMPVRALGGDRETVSVLGSEVPVRHFEFISDKRQDVWLDANGVPVRFRTEQSGKPVDFVLTGSVSSLAEQRPTPGAG